MEDVLAVYTRPHDPDRPLVCLDETSKQLIAETRMPIPMKAGRPARFDYEYERNGVANIFIMFAPLEGWRRVEVTDRHAAVDYAQVLKDLADVHFASAITIVLVQDNLDTLVPASLVPFVHGRQRNVLVPGNSRQMTSFSQALVVLASSSWPRLPLIGLILRRDANEDDNREHNRK